MNNLSYNTSNSGYSSFFEGSYCYGFNGMEKDDEAKGSGNSYTTEFRQYDPRIGRWLSIDNKASKYPYESPYVAFHNNPIFYTDSRSDDPPEKLASVYAEAFKKTWGDSFRQSGNKTKSGETGGVLIKVTNSTVVNGETVQHITYEAHNYKITQEESIRLNYDGVPDNAEIVGDIHTHPIPPEGFRGDFPSPADISNRNTYESKLGYDLPSMVLTWNYESGKREIYFFESSSQNHNGDITDDYRVKVNFNSFKRAARRANTDFEKKSKNPKQN